MIYANERVTFDDPVWGQVVGVAMHNAASGDVRVRWNERDMVFSVPFVDLRRYVDPEDRIARALAMLDGLRRGHEMECDAYEVRVSPCLCGADAHNARVDALAAVLRGDDR